MVFNPCLKTLPPQDPLPLRECFPSGSVSSLRLASSSGPAVSPGSCYPRTSFLNETGFLLRARLLLESISTPDLLPPRGCFLLRTRFIPEARLLPSKPLPAHQPFRETATGRRNQNYPSPQKNSLLPSMQVKQYFKCNIYTSIFFIKISHFIFSS